MKKILVGLLIAFLSGASVQAYTIQPGDYLTKIAKEYHTTVAEILEANPDIVNPNLIYAGDFLRLPWETGMIFGATPTPSSSAAMKYVEIPDSSLFVGAIVGDTSIVLDRLVDIYGNNLAMSDFGNEGFGRIDPEGDGTSESFSFTGLTSNSDGTVTLNGVSSTLARYPYTRSSGIIRAHSIGSVVRISNTAAFYDTFANKENNEIVDGLWTFAQLPYAPTSTPTDDRELVTLYQFRQATTTGGINASEVVKGVSELSTGAEAAAGTSLGATGARLALPGSLATSTGGTSGNWIPVTTSTGKIDDSFGGSAESIATLNTNTLVVQNPASASTTPSANGIPIANASGTISLSWLPTIEFNDRLFTTSTTSTANGTTEVYFVTTTISANTLGTTGAVEVNFPVTNMAWDTGDAVIVHMYYGNTLIASSTIVNTTGGQATGYKGYVHAQLLAAGSTSLQKGILYLTTQQTGAINESNDLNAAAVDARTISIDSTQNQTFGLSAQFAQNNTGTNRFVTEGGIGSIVR